MSNNPNFLEKWKTIFSQPHPPPVNPDPIFTLDDCRKLKNVELEKLHKYDNNWEPIEFCEDCPAYDNCPQGQGLKPPTPLSVVAKMIDEILAEPEIEEPTSKLDESEIYKMLYQQLKREKDER